MYIVYCIYIKLHSAHLQRLYLLRIFFYQSFFNSAQTYHSMINFKLLSSLNKSNIFQFIDYDIHIYILKIIYYSKMISISEETKSLSFFQVKNPQLIFKDALRFPDFFNYQLVDPHRIIKVFKDDPNALERIFYYQYLNLCMRSSEGYPQQRAKNLREIFNSKEFRFIFLWNSSKFGYTDHQFKRIGQQFLDIMQSSSKSLDSLLIQYPIVDEVFTYLMRTLLIINGVAEQIQQFIDKHAILEVLSKVFDIQFEVQGNCIRFNQSDIFAYQENPFQIYMVYISSPKLTEFAVQEEQCDSDNKKISQRISNEHWSSKNNGFINYLNSESEKQIFQNSSNSDNLSEMGCSKQTSRLKDYQNKIVLKDNNVSQKKEIFPFELVPIPEIAEIILDNFEKHQQKNKRVQTLFQNVFIEKVSIKKLQKNSLTQSIYSPKSSKQYHEIFGGSTCYATNKSKQSIQINDQKQRMTLKNQIDGENSGNFSKQKILLRENHKKSNTCPESILDEKNNLKNNDFFPKYSQVFEEKGSDFDKNIDINKITKYIPFDSKFSKNDDGSVMKKETNILASNIQLDITSQFTNTVILNQMPQIYSEKIRKTRQRARAYRKTLNKIY